MEKTATLNLRVNPDVKKSAEMVLHQLGVPMTTAIDMFLKQITLTGSIPFAVTLPKAPNVVNADMVSTLRVREMLDEGLEDVANGRVSLAKDVFAQARERRAK